jgi:hypothetical protein
MKSKDQQLLEEAYNEVSKERLLSRIKPEFRKLYVKDLEHFNGSYRDRADVLNKAKQMGHLVEEAYEMVCENGIPPAVLLPIITLLGSIIGSSLSQFVGIYNEDPRTLKEKIQAWFRDRILKKIAKRLKDDPEVIDFVQNPTKKGWRIMMSSKLTEDELQYLKSLNRSYFTWRR